MNDLQWDLKQAEQKLAAERSRSSINENGPILEAEEVDTVKFFNMQNNLIYNTLFL